MIVDECWVIMSIDNFLVGKGIPRDRTIFHINEKNNKRVLTYKTSGVAETNFWTNEFESMSKMALNHAVQEGWLSEDDVENGNTSNIKRFLKAVKCKIITEDGYFEPVEEK